MRLYTLLNEPAFTMLAFIIEIRIEVSQKLKIELSHDSTMPLLGV